MIYYYDQCQPHPLDAIRSDHTYVHHVIVRDVDCTKQKRSVIKYVPDVQVLELFWIKVVNLSCHIQNVPDSVDLE